MNIVKLKYQLCLSRELFTESFCPCLTATDHRRRSVIVFIYAHVWSTRLPLKIVHEVVLKSTNSATSDEEKTKTSLYVPKHGCPHHRTNYFVRLLMKTRMYLKLIMAYICHVFPS